jgi:hypothetical protein
MQRAHKDGGIEQYLRVDSDESSWWIIVLQMISFIGNIKDFIFSYLIKYSYESQNYWVFELCPSSGD